MNKIDLSKNNPFSEYKGDFSSFFSFGSGYDDWVISLMLESILPHDVGGDEDFHLADIGAGSCYWPISFLKKARNIKITAIDPSESLIANQAEIELKNSKLVGNRLDRRCMTAQEFAKICPTAELPSSTPNDASC